MQVLFILLLIIFFLCIFIFYNLPDKEYVNKKIIIEDFYNDLKCLKDNYIDNRKKELLISKYEDLYDSLLLVTNKLEKQFKDDFKNIDTLINEYNKNYINTMLVVYKEYFDNILEYKLDYEQREAILTDEINELVIAGAGAGKTSTMIGKVKYLIDKKKINPKEIVVISFTNDSVKSFKDKLNNRNVECTTFHKMALNILNDEKKHDIASDLLINTVHQYFKEDILNNYDDLSNYIDFMSLFIHIDKSIEDKQIGEIYETEKGFDLETLKEKYLKTKNIITLNHEKVKSCQELAIANFLFLNGIKYEYEKEYKYDTSSISYRQYHPDFYLPEYDIYIEHFGITKDYRTPQYSKIEEKKYLKGIKEKREIHKNFNTRLIETYSYNFYNGDIFDQLEKKLKNYNVQFKEINKEDLYKSIKTINTSIEFNLFKNLICKFISLYKGNNYNENKFDEFINNASRNKDRRSELLLLLINNIYIKYQNNLREKKQIDFDDMINMATKKVKTMKVPSIKYIIIDEFQDISYSRYLLVKALQEKTNAKVVAVGDDWQSIYRFSGCDLDLFISFENYFDNPKILKINRTHRNSQELIDIAGKFIMKNSNGQISKNLLSSTHNQIPIHINYYKNDIYKSALKAVEDLRSKGCKRIAILGRNRSDINMILGKNLSNIKVPYNLKNILGEGVIFTTVNSSKGLEYDGTIICNLINKITGFPNKMADDPILKYVTMSKDNFLYEEERRLLYVALTRTKGDCYLLVPTSNKSQFIKEIIEIGKNNISSVMCENDITSSNPSCPICKSGKLVIRKCNNRSIVGCTNYPLCRFINNDLNLIYNNRKCPKCGGYLIKRKKYSRYFYGCINYPTCDYTEKEK